jgi:hypothetical protein
VARQLRRQQPPQWEDSLHSQELTVEQLELALQVVNQTYQENPNLQQLLIPSQLKHLNPVDWEVLDSLYLTLEHEKSMSQVH